MTLGLWFRTFLVAIFSFLWCLFPGTVQSYSVTARPMQDYLFTQGMKFSEERRPAAAIRVWEKILPDPLYGPCAYILTARLYRKIRRPARAEETLREFMDKHPKSPYRRLAEKMLLDAMVERRKPEAVSRLRSMIPKASKRERPALLLELARLEKARKEYEDAAKHYTDLFLHYPATLQGLRAADELARLVFVGKVAPPKFSEREQRSRANRLFRRGRFDLAVFTYKALLKRNPGDERLRLKLARCLYKSRKNVAAIAWLKKILKKTRSDRVRVEASYLLSLVYWRLDRDKEFEAACRYVIEKGSEKFRRRALFNLAAHHMEKRQFEKAEHNFKRVLGTRPTLSTRINVLWKLAWLDYARGRFAQAARAFRRARGVSHGSSIANPSKYWEARSLMLLKRADDGARLLEQVASSDPMGYYGIAAGRLLKTRGMSFTRNTAARSAMRNLRMTERERSNRVVKRALKLMEKGLHEFALMDLDSLPRYFKASPAVAFLRAKAAHGAHKYRLARDILAGNFRSLMNNPPDNAPKEFLEIAYPRVHMKETLRLARRNSIDPYLVWAVMRQESLYDASAVSPAGALGLMQVTPGATGLVRKGGRVPTRVIAKILDPRKNIAFGVHILAGNLRHFNGRIVPALAAYNADIGKVKQWVRRNAGMQQDEFVENIPYSETRLYVKKVLAGYDAYSHLHGKAGPAGLW
jgi:soluble lytic murein transglycosylase